MDDLCNTWKECCAAFALCEYIIIKIAMLHYCITSMLLLYFFIFICCAAFALCVYIIFVFCDVNVILVCHYIISLCST